MDIPRKFLRTGIVFLAITLTSAAQQPADLDAFFRSVTDGSTARVETLLGEHPEWKDAELFQGIRPLYRASVLGRTEIVALLLKAGASPSTPTDRGSVPLHAAAQHGHQEIARMLLDAGTDLALVNEDGQTALHLACRFKQTQVGQELIKGKAPLDLADVWGRTALHYAAEMGQLELARALAEAGANLDQPDDEGYSPLALARLSNRNASDQVAAYLAGKGATDQRQPVEATDAP